MPEPIIQLTNSMNNQTISIFALGLGGLIYLMATGCSDPEELSYASSMQVKRNTTSEMDQFRNKIVENQDGLRAIVHQNRKEAERLLLDSLPQLSEAERSRMLNQEYEDLAIRLEQAEAAFTKEANQKIWQGKTGESSAYSLKDSILEKYQLKQWATSKGRKRFTEYLDSVLVTR